MTHDALERRERLTMHNATKAQLKQMLKDEKSVTARLYSENQELNGAVDTLTRYCGTAVTLLQEAGLYGKYLEAISKEDGAAER